MVYVRNISGFRVARCTIGWHKMVDDNNENMAQRPGIFKEEPPPHVPHVRNYLNYLGSLIGRFRNSLPKERNGQQCMADTVSLYTGSPVTRQRISRAESGDERISFDIYAAILDQMHAWPDIIWALEKGDASSTRFALLVERELSDDISQAHKDGLRRLRNRKTREELGWE